MDATRAPEEYTDHHQLSEVRPSTKSLPRLPAARLVCLVGPGVGSAYRLGLSPVVIGRAVDVDISINAPDVSRHHARVSWRDGDFVIENLNDRNITAVNGVPVSEPSALQVGDRVQLAASVILVVAPSDDLDQQAARLQKLQAVGQLAAGLTHDFNNALTTIEGNVAFIEMIAHRGHDQPEIAGALADIRAAVRACQRLTRQLLYVAHRKERPKAVTRLASVVEDVASLIKHSLPRSMRVEVDVSRQLRVVGDPGELHQAVLNLCINARDAMPNGGRLIVRASECEIRSLDAPARHLPEGGRYVELLVEDTGVGMNETTLARIFEPFFTTKETGTGLGLATTLGIVRGAGGTIEVASTPGKGTTFRVLLRAVAAPT